MIDLGSVPRQSDEDRSDQGRAVSVTRCPDCGSGEAICPPCDTDGHICTAEPEGPRLVPCPVRHERSSDRCGLCNGSGLAAPAALLSDTYSWQLDWLISSTADDTTATFWLGKSTITCAWDNGGWEWLTSEGETGACKTLTEMRKTVHEWPITEPQPGLTVTEPGAHAISHDIDSSDPVPGGSPPALMAKVLLKDGGPRRRHRAIKARKTAISCQMTTPHVVGPDLTPPVSCRPGTTGSPPTGSRS